MSKSAASSPFFSGRIVRIGNPDDLNRCLRTYEFYSYPYYKPNRIALIVAGIQVVDSTPVALLSPIASGIDMKWMQERHGEFDPLPLPRFSYGGIIRDNEHFQMLELCAVVPLEKLDATYNRADVGDAKLWHAIQTRFAKLWTPDKVEQLLEEYRRMVHKERRNS